MAGADAVAEQVERSRMELLGDIGFEENRGCIGTELDFADRRQFGVARAWLVRSVDIHLSRKRDPATRRKFNLAGQLKPVSQAWQGRVERRAIKREAFSFEMDRQFADVVGVEQALAYLQGLAAAPAPGLKEGTS